MIKNKKYIIALLINGFCIAPLHAPSQTLSTAGSYLIGEDISYAPSSANDSIIQITASNVTLDLGGRILSQSNLTAGCNGIVVNPALTNVVIKNGYIHNITGTGIGVREDCSRIVIDNVVTFSCDLRGINITGVSSSPVTESEIKNCSVLSCCQGAAGDIALHVLQGRKIKVRDNKINSNGLSSHTLSAIRFDSCLECDLKRVDAYESKGSAVKVFDIITSSTCLFVDCVARNNQALGTGLTLTAFAVSGAGNALNIFDNCLAIENTAPTTDPSHALGFDMTSNSSANLFINCKVIGNLAASVDGFRLTGATNCNHNTFIRCLAEANRAAGTAGIASGFSINNGADFGTLQTCFSLFNTSASVAQGLVFQSGTGGSNWSVREGEFTRNIGSSNANSFGIRVVAGSTNFFSKNNAFNNGATQANQMSGVPSGSKFDRDTTNLNSAGAGSGPWGNVDVTP